MHFGYQYIALAAAGLAGIIWGIPAAHRLKKPFDILAAFAVLAGIITFTIAVLLFCIPGFFR